MKKKKSRFGETLGGRLHLCINLATTHLDFITHNIHVLGLHVPIAVGNAVVNGIFVVLAVYAMGMSYLGSADVLVETHRQLTLGKR